MFRNGRPLTSRVAEAQRHVNAGKAGIVSQRDLIAEMKAQGRNTETSQELLAALERSQIILESFFEQIRNDGGSATWWR